MRLFVFTVYSVCAFAALIFAAQALGNAQPPSDALAQLHLTDCALPCWLGITPGVTLFDAAVARVNAVYPTSDALISGEGRAPRYNVDTPFGQVLLLADSAGIVHRITLPMFKLKALRLADVVGLLGTPTGVGGRPPVAVFYGCESFQAVVAGGSVDGGWWQRPVLIDIQDVGFSCQGAKDDD